MDLTLQGDIYRGDFEQALVLPTLTQPYSSTVGRSANASGANLLGRWTKSLSPTSEFMLQAYYDHTFRTESFLAEQRDTSDFDAQYRFQPMENHDVIGGVSYRWTRVDYSRRFPVCFDLKRPVRQLVGGFIQDEITLIPYSLKFESVYGQTRE
ncbi:hypothetical protein [Methylomagnum sp.]